MDNCVKDDVIWAVVEQFITKVLSEIYLDTDQFFREKCSLIEAIHKTNEMTDYLGCEISSQMQKLRGGSTAKPSAGEINEILQSALTRTFEVFKNDC